MYTDTTDSHSIPVQTQDDSEFDSLTGVYTRKAFLSHAEELLRDDPDGEYDLIVTDINNFKLVNETYGWETGDKVLQYIAKRYANAARKGFCGRYDADRFVVLGQAMTDEELPLLRVQANQLSAEAPVPYLTLRYGVYHNVDRMDSVTAMCDKAMIALRSRKNRNDPVTLYDQEIVRSQLRAQKYEADFERALAGGEFVIWAQPKYSAFTKNIISAEALVRWKTADGKFISPGEFIPVFEADGLIVRLDEYVFRYVCTRQREQLDAGRTPLPVSVNVSRATLFRPGTVERYTQIIEEIGVPKKLVPIELTESATVENLQINSLVRDLKVAGFGLHLDDFGSGYSSLSSLSELKLDTLKLDKSLIDGIGDRGGDEIIRHITELAHFLQMEVVAEGVERNDQYFFLKKLGCDTIQGYLFSRPLPFDEYLQLLEERPEEVSEMIEGEALSGEADIGSLRITNDAKMQYLTALARIYMTMHVIDLQEDTVVEFATTTNVKEHCNKAHGCVGQMKASMAATVAPEYVDAVLRFTDLTTIAERMKGKKTICEEFVGKHFGWFRARFITVTADEEDRPVVLIYTTQVIEEDKRREETMIRACRTDELTGVYNRFAFDEDISMLKSAPDLVIMSVDINGLRAANEQFGRAAGDDLLWGTADTLNSVLGKGSLIYRTGGDHFAAIFHADPDKLDAVLKNYKDTVHNWIGNNIRSLSTSFGIASQSEFPEFSLAELLEEADRRRLAYKKDLRQTGSEANDR